VSLDAKVFDDAVTSLVDTLASSDSDQEEVYATSQDNHRVHDVVHTALSVLDKRERYIVEHRLMADTEEEVSLAEIGRRLGVSRERARQLEARAKRKLKQKIFELSGSTTLEGLSLESAA
jgi:RNA polymerase sigma-32 factor